MDFEIDVSGEDIFSHDYIIVIADKNNIIKGFKFDRNLIQSIRFRHSQGFYRYSSSRLDKAYLRIRIYCIVIYYLFKSVNFKDKYTEVNLDICKDFQGHEKDITSNLKYFLENLIGIKVNIRYVKLSKKSNADKYAYLMRMDTKNNMKGYVKISLEEIEKYLVKN